MKTTEPTVEPTVEPTAEPAVKRITEAKSRNDYTVGWVCALPKEQTAAKAMLDELHAAVQKPANDPNSYSLGSIGGHNIVIAGLPKGQTGNHPAATVATWMVSTFPCIKFGLLVGIGGGIPPKVKLGDVVVSTPIGHFPGVVQYDMGREGIYGFERTGSLNNPPSLLLTALTNLESDHEMGEPKMFKYLEELRVKWPKLAPKYLQSESLKDVLFQTNYNHVRVKNQSGGYWADEEENCKNCKPEKTVKRDPREPRVHYGLIASGSKVIKDGISRAYLNESLGNQALCVEMEAAGLMNNFPCLVIRGISDYADSHKNDSWQEHAAAMAAAYTKELLQYVQPADVARQPAAREIMKEIHSIVSQTGADVTKLITMADMNEKLKILHWLTPNDYSPQQNKYIKIHEKGTGQWLLDSAEFNIWIETKKQILFCPGIPGAGKTIITALVVYNLSLRFAHDPKVGIAYIYFNFWQQEEHTVEDLFAGLLKQLAKSLSPLPASLKALYDEHKGRGVRPPLYKVLEVLQFLIRISYERVFIVVDALDECQESNNCRRRFIEGLFRLQQCGANIFATSRPITDVTDRFDKSTWLEIRASDDDIRAYVDGQISQGRSKYLLEMRVEASTAIAKAADGMFLLAKLDLNSLLDAKLPKDARERLKNLPKGSEAYSYAYQEIMKRVEHQGPKSVKFAKSVLSWVTFARRPLIISELQHALAVEIGDREFNDGNLPQVQDLISVCAGLVTVDLDSNVIWLFHYTAQEYFEQTQNQWFPDAERDITKICITYLSFDIFETGFSSTDTAFEERLQSYQLYDYAAHNWGHHARKSAALDPLVLDFLESETKAEASSQALFAIKEPRRPNYSRYFPNKTGGLHLAAYFGIDKAVKRLLNSYDPDPKDSYGRTPLSLAAENGHEAVVQLLLYNGANSRARDHWSLTPLSWAAMGGHETIMRLLDTGSPSQLDDIADAAKRKLQKFNLIQESVHMIKKNEQNDREWQRLSQDADAINIRLGQIKDRKEKIDDELRKIQSEKKRLTEEENYKVGEILNLAKMQAEVEEKQGQLSKQWLDTQSRLDELRQIDGYKHEYELEKIRDLMLFRWAVEDGYAKIVELLLCGGTDATITHEDGWLPLHMAASKGYVDVAGLLIDMGKVQVDSKDHNGQIALQVAAEKGHQDVVDLLLEKAAATVKCQQTLEGHRDTVYSLAFSHNSKLIASGSVDKTVRLWDTATGKCQQTLKGHRKAVYSVAFSHDSKLIASGSADMTIKLWDTATGKCRRTLRGHSDTIYSVTFSHNSKLIASGSVDKTIKLWDAAKGKCRRTLSGHSDTVYSVAFAHDSKLIASGAADNTIKLWYTATGKCRRTLKGHSDLVYSVAFLHNLNLIASGSEDKTIRLWDLVEGKCRRTLKGHSDSVESVTFSRKSRVIASGSRDLTVKLWDIATPIDI